MLIPPWAFEFISISAINNARNNARLHRYREKHLVELGLARKAGLADSLEAVEGADAVNVRGVDRQLERSMHVALRRQVVELVRLSLDEQRHLCLEQRRQRSCGTLSAVFFPPQSRSSAGVRAPWSRAPWRGVSACRDRKLMAVHVSSA